MTQKWLDLTGQPFGRLIAKRRAANSPWGGARWICECECGNVVNAACGKLRRGKVKSCGCLMIDIVRKKATKHGSSKHPLYLVWLNMMHRCYQPRNKSYQNYGKRGIIVYDEWKSPSEFISYVSSKLGPKPSPKHELDRIDNDGNYEPGNIQWATKAEQSLNRRNHWELKRRAKMKKVELL